jgi:hypothetical protein
MRPPRRTVGPPRRSVGPTPVRRSAARRGGPLVRRSVRPVQKAASARTEGQPYPSTVASQTRNMAAPPVLLLLLLIGHASDYAAAARQPLAGALRRPEQSEQHVIQQGRPGEQQAAAAAADEACLVRCNNMVLLLTSELLSKAASIIMSNGLGVTELRQVLARRHDAGNAAGSRCPPTFCCQCLTNIHAPFGRRRGNLTAPDASGNDLALEASGYWRKALSPLPSHHPPTPPPAPSISPPHQSPGNLGR